MPQFLVFRGRIIGTDIMFYDVYEAAEPGSNGHSGLTYISETERLEYGLEYDGWAGDVRTRRLPAVIGNMLPGLTRISAVQQFYSRSEYIYRLAVLKAFTEDDAISTLTTFTGSGPLYMVNAPKDMSREWRLVTLTEEELA